MKYLITSKSTNKYYGESAFFWDVRQIHYASYGTIYYKYRICKIAITISTKSLYHEYF